MDIPIGKVIFVLDELAYIVDKCGSIRFKMVSKDIKDNANYLRGSSYSSVYEGVFNERNCKFGEGMFTFAVVWAGRTFVFGEKLVEILQKKELDSPIGNSVKLAYNESMVKWHSLTIRMLSKSILSFPINTTVRELGENILTRKDILHELSEGIENCVSIFGIKPYN